MNWSTTATTIGLDVSAATWARCEVLQGCSAMSRRFSMVGACVSAVHFFGEHRCPLRSRGVSGDADDSCLEVRL